VLAVFTSWMLAGCEVDKAAQPWPHAGKLPDPGVSTIPLANGYYKGRAVQYWDAGAATPAVSNVCVLYRKGSNTPIPFDQQYPIVDAVVGDAAYSPFRHVIKVTVPASYVANTMTSIADLVNALYLDPALPVFTYTAWDAPSVDENATLDGSSEAPMPVWYDGRIAFVFRFADNDVLVNRNTGEVAVSEIIEISRSGEQLAGNTIFSVRKGDQGYSPLRRETIVSVTEAYPVSGPAPWQSLTAAELNIGAFLVERTETETLVNHPIKSVGTYTLVDEDRGHVDDSDPALYPAGDIPERLAWYNGTRRSYFDLGTDSGVASEVWVLYRTGLDTPIEGQSPIANSVPGDTTYGAARRVHRVYLDPSAGYTPNSIKSYVTLLQLGATEEVRQVWNAPAVHRDARVDGQSPRTGWARGQSFDFFLFEEDVNLAEGGFGVTFMPTFEIYRQRDSADQEGEWQDYNSLVPSVPGGDSYSAFRDMSRILVAPAYPDTAWRSFFDATTDPGIPTGYKVSTFPVSGIQNRPMRQ
jgi:hypothetical protein